MPEDPEKLKASYVKRAHAILRLTPEKREKAEKKLKDSLEAKTAHIEKLEKEMQLYSNKDENGLVAHTKSLQEQAENGRDEEISDFRVPTTLKEDKLDRWWDTEVAGLQTKLNEVKVDYDCLYGDNKTLLDLQIDDLEQQKAIIEPLKFEDMERHFGGKLVHGLADKDLKTIEKEVNKKKAAIKNKIEKSLKALPENAKVPKAEMDKKIKAAQDLEIDKHHKDLHSAKLTEKNKARFTEIRENELYRIGYKLHELQEEHIKLTGEKHEKETD